MEKYVLIYMYFVFRIDLLPWKYVKCLKNILKSLLIENAFEQPKVFEVIENFPRVSQLSITVNNEDIEKVEWMNVFKNETDNICS